MFIIILKIYLQSKSEIIVRKILKSIKYYKYNIYGMGRFTAAVLPQPFRRQVVPPPSRSAAGPFRLQIVLSPVASLTDFYKS